MNDIPDEACRCGCGGMTTPHVRTGKPQRFINGHQNRKPLAYRAEERGYPSPCWIWVGSIAATGYGTFTRDRVKHAAHRWAWSQHHGKPVPAGMLICHHCDIRSCVRWDHLFLGTSADNVHDAQRKYRTRGGGVLGSSRPTQQGELHVLAKLTAGSVRDIRRRYATESTSERKLASEYHVTRGAIRRVLNRTSWRHIKD